MSDQAREVLSSAVWKHIHVNRKFSISVYQSIHLCSIFIYSLGTPIYNLFPMSTISVQPDKLVRSTPKWHNKRYRCTRARIGHKRQASEQGLFHQDNSTMPSVVSPVQQNTAELSSECVVVSAPKRAKVETQPTEIEETSCSHIPSISGPEPTSTSQTTDIRWTSESNSCTLNMAKTYTADHKDLSSSHILNITDIEEVSNPHNSKYQEISTETRNLNITSQSSAGLQVASENEQADLHGANKATVNLENQCELTSEIPPHEGVRPVGDSLSSRKRPREQFEELFDAATLTRPKRRRKSHTGRRWRQVKGGSRGRRWRRWKKEENWNRRERRKKNQYRKKEGMSVAQIYCLLLVYNHGN